VDPARPFRRDGRHGVGSSRPAAARFYRVLLALELAIFLFFTGYGALVQWPFQPKWNLTLGEI
jgi:hypothetical protein